MFQKLGQVMVYVENQDRAVDFWKEKLGFHVRSEEKGKRDALDRVGAGRNFGNKHRSS